MGRPVRTQPAALPAGGRGDPGDCGNPRGPGNPGDCGAG